MSDARTDANSPPGPADLVDFFSGLPHRIAGAGLSSSQVTEISDLLESLVHEVEQAGYPPLAVDGPDPAGFPAGADRIVGAANQLHGLLGALDPIGWEAVTATGDSVAERSGQVRRELVQEFDVPA